MTWCSIFPNKKSNPTIKVVLLLKIAERISIDEPTMTRKLRFNLVNYIIFLENDLIFNCHIHTKFNIAIRCF